MYQFTNESDMAILFDTVSKAIAVSFRGKVIYLPDPYLDPKADVAAGEERCRRLRWLDPSRPGARNRLIQGANFIASARLLLA
ncbi:hypothetical protein CPY51_04065 [Rhizobium tubonense]|uniref:Uncharacterized protein n=1 Tax=Rhizobium tubonense TaxID=484088 RepID=A0A2W4F3J0_9HYPH|nr:hypothetical protein CPY51_04065 [Rhizobium tubonense]